MTELNDELDDDLYDDIRDFLRTELYGGFTPFGGLVQNAVEVHEGEAEDGELEAIGREVLAELVDEYRAESSTWPARTDCDRLVSAFEALRQRGVLALENYWCCGTCGLSAIGGDMDDAAASMGNVRGFAFYHQQDTESAAQGHGLYLNYGASDGSETMGLFVGEEVAHVIGDHDLTVEWDGSWSKRIHVRLDWKRRRRDLPRG